jgi:hypothetical protein
VSSREQCRILLGRCNRFRTQTRSESCRTMSEARRTTSEICRATSESTKVYLKK